MADSKKEFPARALERYRVSDTLLLLQEQIIHAGSINRWASKRGVAPSSVSRTLRGGRGIGPETLEKLVADGEAEFLRPPAKHFITKRHPTVNANRKPPPGRPGCPSRRQRLVQARLTDLAEVPVHMLPRGLSAQSSAATCLMLMIRRVDDPTGASPARFYRLPKSPG